MSVDYTEVLQDLRSRRDKLIVAISAIEEIMGASADKPAARVAAAIHGPSIASVLRAQLPRPGTVGSMAYELVKEHGAPMKVVDIVRALEEKGKFKAAAKGNYGTVFGSLKADARFVKIGSAEYDLHERSRVHGVERLTALEEPPAAAQS